MPPAAITSCAPATASRDGYPGSNHAEDLVNDATALILFSFAVAAVETGGVPVAEVAISFVLIVIGELIWGVGVGWAMLRLRHWVRDPKMEIVLALLAPSGVLAATRARVCD